MRTKGKGLKQQNKKKEEKREIGGCMAVKGLHPAEKKGHLREEWMSAGLAEICQWKETRARREFGEKSKGHDLPENKRTKKETPTGLRRLGRSGTLAGPGMKRRTKKAASPRPKIEGGRLILKHFGEKCI